MLVNYENIKTAFQGFQALFTETWDLTQTQYEQIAAVMSSSSELEDYDWLGDIPKMSEWIGPRIIKQLRAQKWSIRNKLWQWAIEIDRMQFQRDKLGMIRPRIQGGASEGKRHLDELLFTLLANGFVNAALPYGMSNLCYDGQYFFDSDHSEGKSGTQNNVGSAAYSLSAVVAAVGAMMSIKDDEGKPIGVVPDTLVVCPLDYLQAVADCASINMVAATATAIVQTNPLAKLGLNVITSPFAIPVISGTAQPHSWYLLCTKSHLKPLIAQVEVPIEIQAIDDPNSEYVVRNHKFLFGAWGSYNVGFSLWQMAYGSVHT